LALVARARWLIVVRHLAVQHHGPETITQWAAVVALVAPQVEAPETTVVAAAAGLVPAM
jgi:hypothetical protein